MPRNTPSTLEQIRLQSAREKLKREAALAEREALRLEAERPEEEDEEFFNLERDLKPLSPLDELKMCEYMDKGFVRREFVKTYVEGYEPYDNHVGIWFMERGIRIIQKVMKAGPEVWDAIGCEADLNECGQYLLQEKFKIHVPGWATRRIVEDYRHRKDVPDWVADLEIVLERYESGKWVA